MSKDELNTLINFHTLPTCSRSRFVLPMRGNPCWLYLKEPQHPPTMVLIALDTSFVDGGSKHGGFFKIIKMLIISKLNKSYGQLK